LIFRKRKLSRFYSSHAPYKTEEFCWAIKILDDHPIKTKVGGKEIEIYEPAQYKITKKEPSPNRFRKYLIAGKIATANWSGEVYEEHLKRLGKDKLVKVHGLEKQGLGYRWFLTGNHTRKSGIYFQSTKTAGRPSLVTNFVDYTDIVTYVYQEGGPNCDFKDSKKPEKLIDMILDMTTKKNDLVMDFFGGSGTTIACCIKKKRSCIIIENGQHALDVLYTRLENMKSGKDIDGIKHKFHYSNANIAKTLTNFLTA
jgi:adenine-specific DNA-methyltransferase